MKFDFDIRTLGLITMVSSLVVAFAMVTVSRLIPSERSLRDWAIGALMTAGGTLLIALRGLIPDWISIGVANFLTIAGIGHIYVGVGGFYARPVHRRWVWIAAGFVFLGCMYYSVVEPNLVARIILSSLCYMPFLAMCAWFYWRYPDPDLPSVQRVSAVIFALGTVLFFIRLIKAPGAQLAADYTATSNVSQAIPYLYSILFNVWLSVTVIMGVSARLQRSMMEARDRAEMANVAKSQFLANMSHEIRTPLNGILGMAQLLQMPDVGEPERKEFAGTIVKSGNALLMLLNDILDLSKVEAGKIDIDPVPFAPEEVLAEINVLLSEIAAQKGLKLSGKWLGSAGQTYLGDPLRLRQMMINLVGNGIKFTAHGEVAMQVREVRREGTGAVLEFSVTDTGIGVAESDRKRLFQMFSQIDGSSTRRFEGAGLGLAIVRKLAEMMGGEVGLESEPGKGSRFWFTVTVELLPN